MTAPPAARDGHIEKHKLRRWDHLPQDTAVQRFNRAAAIWCTKVVGTMWCAYAFAAFDLLALPNAIQQGLFGIVQWVASFFLQLVLLSVIMVGQNVQGEAADARAIRTFEDVEIIKSGMTELRQMLQDLAGGKGVVLYAHSYCAPRPGLQRS